MTNLLICFYLLLISMYPLYAEDTLVKPNGDTIRILDDGTWKPLNPPVTQALPPPPATQTDPCDSLIMKHQDKMTGKAIIAAQKPIIISEDGEKGFRLSLLLSTSKAELIFSTKVYGASGCIEEATAVYLLFQDGDRRELKSNNEFNCEGTMTLYMGRGLGSSKMHILKLLQTKPLSAMRVYTARSYVEEDIPIEQATLIQQTINCLCKEAGL